MADEQAPPAGGGEEVAEPGGWDAGRVLDWAGGAAAVLLIVILLDVWTDGRLISRRLQRREDGGSDDEPAG